ncbi:MAG: DUF2959 family protein [Desulfatibacillaceae bacterium]
MQGRDLPAVLKYAALERSMASAEQSMENSLAGLRDYMLYMKHNLNARAVGVLRDEAGAIGQDIAGLIREMEQSSTRAREFLETME